MLTAALDSHSGLERLAEAHTHSKVECAPHVGVEGRSDGVPVLARLPVLVVVAHVVGQGKFVDLFLDALEFSLCQRTCQLIGVHVGLEAEFDRERAADTLDFGQGVANFPVTGDVGAQQSLTHLEVLSMEQTRLGLNKDKGVGVMLTGRAV